MKKIKNLGFTLVELLVVIIIIGILSTSILPKITNYLSHTRDLKRNQDLETLAAAIEIYHTQHGQRPLRRKKNEEGFFSFRERYFREAESLKEELEGIINKIPKDPANGQIDVCSESFYHRGICLENLKKGQYLYQIVKSKYPSSNDKASDTFIILVAKVENPDKANYVLVERKKYQCPGCARFFGQSDTINRIFPAIFSDDRFQLCDSIEKGEQAKREKDSSAKYRCTYTTPDQLYHIKIVR